MINFNMNMNILCMCDSNYGIGYKNQLPWHIPSDFMEFKKKTLNQIVIMGRKTFESINSVPLTNRINIVISTTLKNNVSYCGGTILIIVQTPNEAILESAKYYKNIFIIGGTNIFRYFLEHNLVDKVILSKMIDKKYTCDTFFPIYSLLKLCISDICEIKKSTSILFNHVEKIYNEKVNYEIEEYCLLYKNKYEKKYLGLITKIINNGISIDGRNGGTLSLFGQQLKFNLTNEFPLLTTKQMFVKGIVEELLFFLRGDTDTTKLSEKGVKIWEGNTSKEFLNNRGLSHYKEGEMGKMYGYNWRKFNDNYDQLKKLITDLLDKENKENKRRLLLTTYNPSVVDEGVLYPCHGLTIQFYVRGIYLDCHMYQRSCDVGLGLPFNISSYALLTYIICESCNRMYKPGQLIISFGDTHIYNEHKDLLIEQSKRIPFMFPQLKITKVKDITQDAIEYIENLSFGDFKIVNYKHYPKISLELKC